MNAQLRLRDLTLGYDRHPAVHHLSGDVAAGSLLAVVGPNGAGKSTLFRGIVGMLKPLSGSIARDGLKPRDIAYLPQSADIDRSFPISVFDFVAAGLWRRTGLFGAHRPRRPCAHRRGARRCRPDRFREPRHRHAVGRPDAAHAVRAAAAAGRARHRARRAVQRHRRSRHRPISSIWCASWHAEKRTVIAALHDLHLVRDIFPRRCCWRARRSPGA